MDLLLNAALDWARGGIRSVRLHVSLAGALLVSLLAAGLLGVPAAWGQTAAENWIKPATLKLGETTYQLLYEGAISNHVQTARLQTPAGVQGQALMMFYPGRTKGTAYLPAEKYLFEMSRERTIATRIVEPPADGPFDQEIALNDQGGIRPAGYDTPADPANPVTIDLMVLYTPAAREAVGGASNILDKIHLAVAEANQAYAESGIGVILNLVHARSINYAESASMSTDLYRLAASDGIMDEVQTLRTQYGADMVSLLVNSSDMYAGIAYVLTGASDWAFSVIQALYANGYYVFPHELGHNFGCAHDRQNASVGGAYSYSYGYRFDVGSLTYRTIMSYAPGIRVGLFSTPEKTFLGKPVGTATEDNARTINQRASIIAGLQGAPSYTLTLVRNGTGSVLHNGAGMVASQLTVTRGEMISLSASGAFLCWSGCVNSSATNVQFLINSNATITANFADGASPLAPQITRQPVGQNVPCGAAVELTAEALGIPAPSFVWQRNGVSVGTGRRYALASAAQTDQGSYRCVISNSAGIRYSDYANVVVGAAPQIVQQPVSQLGLLGGNVLFSVLVDAANLSYQWYFNEQPLPLATNRDLAILDIKEEHVGAYYVEAKTAAYTVRSHSAQLLLVSPPVIVQQPRRAEVTVGQTTTFTVEAQGIQPLTCQWQFNGRAMAGETNFTLVLPNVKLSQAGPYRARVANPHGITFTTNATLVVYTPLTLSQQPSNIVAIKGTTPIFAVQAAGSEPITYQWFRDDQPLANQVYSTCRLKNVQPTNAGTYRVVIKNPSGTLDSASATLTVLEPPVITRQPQPVIGDEGGEAAFFVAIESESPCEYQWYKNGALLDGQTASNLVLANLSAASAANYKVRIGNRDGSVFSQDASLQVNLLPRIVAQPVSLSVSQGGNATFRVAAGGCDPLTYRWFFGSQPVGVNSDTLYLSPVQASQAGGYFVEVSNRLGVVRSATATLTIKEPPKISGLPTMLRLDEGQTLTLEPVLQGKEPMTCTWKKGGQIVGTANVLSLPNCQEAQAGYYSLQVVNSDGAATSPEVQVVIGLAPKILTQPSPATAANGGAATFSVSAKGLAPLAFYWHKDGTFLREGTNVLTLTNVELSAEGRYSVLVSNRIGTVLSTNVPLAVSYPPLITRHPAAVSAPQGQPVSFSVAAQGRLPMTYVWTKNGYSLAETTNPILSLATASLSDAGAYGVIVRNADGQAASSNALLTVIAPPAFLIHPREVTLRQGQGLALECSVSSLIPVTYQWSRNGLALEGATNAALVLAGARLDQAGTYQVCASNAAGVTCSREAIVTVLDPPVFVRQPEDLSVYVDDEAVFHAHAASSVQPITYQWRFNGVDLPGETQPVLTFKAALAKAGFYSVEARNTDGATVSQSACLTVSLNPPVIVNEYLTNLTVAPGSYLDVTLQVKGRQPISIQWSQNGANLADQTQLKLRIKPFQAGNVGTYLATLSNEHGLTLSQPIVVNSGAWSPRITRQPVSVSVPWGGTATFAIDCENPADLAYQWLKNRQPMPDQTNATLVLADVQDTDVGNYSVEVSNEYGTAASVPANLTLLDPPVITAEPWDVLVNPGGTCTFQVQAQGGGTLAYQWFFNGEPIALATHTNCSVVNAQAANAGLYYVRVSNEAGTNRSREVSLTLREPPVVVQPPASLNRRPGEDASFTVVARGREPLNYQWYCGTNLLPGANESTLLLTNLQPAQTGGYYVALLNPDGQTNSASAFLNVHEPPVITRQPQSVRATVGQYVTFTVRADSGSALKYLWFFNGSAISGAVASNYTVTAALAREGEYLVAVSNAVGGVLSEAAHLTLARPPVITSQPQSKSVTLNSAQELTVTAQGREPMTYLWHKQGVLIQAAGAGRLSFPSIAVSDLASYFVVITNSDGAITSQVAALSAPATELPPGIIRQPQSTTAVKGLTASLSVIATGKAPLTYQWSHEGVALEDETNATLTLNPVSETHLGDYTVLVRSPLGEAESQPARLTLAYRPEILSQPASLTVLQGNTLNLSAVTTNADLHYWVRNSSLISVGPLSALSLANAQAEHAGAYWLIASNLWGGVTSQVIQVTVQLRPYVVAQPASQTVSKGAQVTLNLAAGGTGPLAYQWYKNNAALDGATNASLALSGVTIEREGVYYVRITNPYGSVNSADCTLAVRDVPVFLSQPASQTVNQGANLTLSASASGRAPLTYRWYRNGYLLPGAASGALTIASAQPSDAGNYTVLVANSDGSVTSQPAAVTVRQAPFMLAPTYTLNVPIGGGVTLLANIGGTAPMTYQWRFNGTNIAGATSNTFPIVNIQISQEGTYSVVASNLLGSLTCNVAVVTVKSPPVITRHPAGLGVLPGSSVSLSVAATGRAPLTYQWKKAGQPISGATTSTLTLDNVQTNDAGSYQATVANADGTVDSRDAVVWVATPPTITAQPADLRVVFDQTASLGATVSSLWQPLTYQWFKDGLAIPGATNLTLTIPNARVADEGHYVLLVQNDAGVTASRKARLTVIYPPKIVSHPQTRTVKQGQNLSLEVTAQGKEPMTYRWFRNNGPLAELQSRVLLIQNVQPEHAGAYFVVVANADGTATSQSVTVTVRPVPVILTNPATTIVTISNQLSLQVAAASSTPMTYQWIKDGVNVTGETNATLTVTNTQFEHAGIYTVVVANSAGAVESEPAIVLVLPIQPLRIPKDQQEAQVLQIVAIGNGQVGFLYYAAVGRTYEIQASTDWTTWTSLATVVATRNVSQFVDAAAPNFTARFYRIKLVR